MKCRIYLQDGVMNHITGPVNQLIKMDKWFNNVMHLRIWDEGIWTHSDISHIKKKCYFEISLGIKLDGLLCKILHVLLSLRPWILSWPQFASCSDWELSVPSAFPTWVSANPAPSLYMQAQPSGARCFHREGRESPWCLTTGQNCQGHRLLLS